MMKDGELYFLKIIEDGRTYRSAVWVWDTCPGERRKGLPIFVSDYAGKHATPNDAIKYFKERGFEFKRPGYKAPRWMGELKIEERLAKFMDEIGEMKKS